MADRTAFSGSPPPRALLIVLGVMALIELALTVSDRGLLPGAPGEWRAIAIIHGAFWRQLLDGSLDPVYSWQPAAMFVTHAFLHGGIFHLVMNGVIILSLGKFAADRFGTAALLWVLLVSAVAGGAGFWLLSDGEAPMVGASGAGFGLLGLWQFWEAALRRHRGETLRPVLATIGALVLANAALAVALGGYLAWQAHLGGFLAGFAMGPVLMRARRRGR